MSTPITDAFEAEWRIRYNEGKSGSGDVLKFARDLELENVALTKAVLEWWEKHRFDTHSDGEDEYNVYDGAPDFVKQAQAIAAAALRNAAEGMRATLERIAKWHGEFPEATLRDGTKISYGAAYGSDGERDFMRKMAQSALVAYLALRPEGREGQESSS